MRKLLGCACIAAALLLVAACSSGRSLPGIGTSPASESAKNVPPIKTAALNFDTYGNPCQGGRGSVCSSNISCPSGATCYSDGSGLPDGNGGYNPGCPQIVHGPRRRLCLSSGGGGGGGVTPPYNSWKTSICSSERNAAVAAGQSIYLISTTTNKGTGQEYGSVIAKDPAGQIHYSNSITSGASDYVDFGPILNHMPSGWHAIGYVHVHPELYQSDDEALDGVTGTHFSQGDEDVAFDYQIDAYVIVGGTTDMFEWTPPTPAQGQNYTKSDSGSLGSVNSGNPGC